MNNKTEKLKFAVKIDFKTDKGKLLDNAQLSKDKPTYKFAKDEFEIFSIVNVNNDEKALYLFTMQTISKNKNMIRKYAVLFNDYRKFFVKSIDNVTVDTECPCDELLACLEHFLSTKFK